jgi:hypothetical protein
MEGRSLTDRPSSGRRSRTPTWLMGLLPLALVAGALVVFAALNAPGLPERAGPPIEELAVERTVLRPGEITLTLRNDGPDPVQVAQVEINGGYVDFRTDAEATGRLATRRVEITYPWVEGEAYRILLLTSTGATVATEIPVAVATPRADGGFYATMALIGFYVGIVPVVLGMLWLPWVRRVSAEWIRVLMAVTVGLLVFLALDATLDGFQIAASGAQSLGGGALVLGGAVVAYLLLSGVDAWVRARRGVGEAAGGPWRLALLISIGVGLHNLAEGLAIGSAYAIGELALGALLVVGFVLQNTSEGLAIVAPLAREKASWRRLVLLGVVAGVPTIAGAWIGAAAFNPSVAALLIGAGVGAIAQVVQQILPAVRDTAGRVLYPASVAGIIGGMAILYLTGLFVAV